MALPKESEQKKINSHLTLVVQSISFGEISISCHKALSFGTSFFLRVEIFVKNIELSIFNPRFMFLLSSWFKFSWAFAREILFNNVFLQETFNQSCAMFRKKTYPEK